MAYLPGKRSYVLPVRLGMVGGGNDAFIGEIHRIASRVDDRYRLLAGALSSTPERSRLSGERLGLDPGRSYSDFTEMARKEAARPDGIEAVSIVTPNHLHAAAAIPFLRRGIHVICDKPLTATLEQAQELAAEVRRGAALFVLTHNYTGYPMVRQARDIVHSGDLGPIRFVAVEYSTDWLATAKETEGLKQAEWRTDPRRAGVGGCVADIGTHAFHLLRFITGMTVNELSGELVTFIPGRPVDDHVQVQLRFAEGGRGTLWASQVTVGDENGLRIRVYGQRGSLDWHQEEPNRLWYTRADGTRQLVTRMGRGASASAAAVSRTPAGLPEGYLEGFANLYTEAADAIVAARDGGAPVHPDTLPGLEDGLVGMAFIDAVIRSSVDNGAWIMPVTL
jgi:predicted dehydrogenase